MFIFYGERIVSIMKGIQSFYKLHGCGNDFIIIDIRNISLSFDEMQEYARTLCAMHFSVGADGIVFIDTPQHSDTSYKWHFYNADGLRAEMCGNASRCVAYLAERLGIAPKEHSFETDVGRIHVVVDSDTKSVKSQLTSPHSVQYDKKLVYKGITYIYHTVNTGVPHAVIFVDDVASIPVAELGAFIRHHYDFAPYGTNVNFVQLQSDNSLLIRTFERGVEAETYACGTGAVASVVIANGRGLVEKSADVITFSGEHLSVFLEGNDVFLQGPVAYIFHGILV